MIVLLLFGAVSAEHSGLLRSAPAWANVPRFVHCFNHTGPINSDALALWTRPSVRIVTFGCCQAQLATPVNQSEELKIVAAGHQVLEAGSSAQTVLYFPVSARPYYSVGAWAFDHPTTLLHNSTGGVVPGNLFDFGQPSVRSAVISQLSSSLHSGWISGFFLDGAQYSGLVEQAAGCTPAIRERFLQGHIEFHKELRHAVGTTGPIITLGDLYEGDSGELLGLLFLAADGLSGDVWQGIESVLQIRTKSANATIELIHDGSNRALALAVFLLLADGNMLFHSPTSQRENFDLWSCDGSLDEPPEWSAPLGEPMGPYVVDSTNTSLSRSFRVHSATSKSVLFTNVTVEIPHSTTERCTSCILWADGTSTGTC